MAPTLLRLPVVTAGLETSSLVFSRFLLFHSSPTSAPLLVRIWNMLRQFSSVYLSFSSWLSTLFTGRDPLFELDHLLPSAWLARRRTMPSRDVVAVLPTMLDEGVSYLTLILSRWKLTLCQALLVPLRTLSVLLLLLDPAMVHDSTATPTVSSERAVLHLVERPEVHHLQAVARVLPTFTGTSKICCGR